MKMRPRIYLIIIFVFVSFIASAHSVVERDGYYEVEHAWICNGKQYAVTLNISTALYDYYQDDREHLVYHYQFNEEVLPPSYYSFMLSEHDRSVMRALADEFSSQAVSEKEQIDLALTFVQSLPYAFDANSKGVDEYVRYPVETLVDGCGDCEDKVALLAAMLYEMDVDFILLALPEHLAIGVHCDGVEANRYLWFRDQKYYYMETTALNWRIGQIPEDYESAEMEVIPIDDTPNLIMKGVRFESKSSSKYSKASCVLEVDLHNQGPGKATDVVLRVRVVERGRTNRLLTEQYFSLSNLEEGEERTEKLSFKTMIKANCAVEVELTGAEVAPITYQLGLDYTRTRRF